MNNNKLLSLSFYSLLSCMTFSHTLTEEQPVFEIPSVNVNDSLLGKEWSLTPSLSDEDFYIQEKLDKLEINSILHPNIQRLNSLATRQKYIEPVAKRLSNQIYRIKENSWSIYDPISGDFSKKTPEDIGAALKDKRVAVMVHGCDSRKEDMTDLVKIISNLNQDMYDYFIFFEYDSTLGIESIAYTYSQSLYDIIKNSDIKFSIFTHSMGGLINRRALKMPVKTESFFSKSLMDKIVDNQKDLCLVTFGTPHGGVPVNALYSGLLYVGHPSVQDMMTSNDILNPSRQSSFLSCLNNRKKWKHSKNLHLFTVAGNAAESYDSYHYFKGLNYKNYSNEKYDGLVAIDSAFHPQLGYESQSWKKDLTHRMVIPANHYNMKGSKSMVATSELPGAISLRVKSYHIVSSEDTNHKILDQNLVQDYSQQELEILYHLFQSEIINHDCIEKFVKDYISENKFELTNNLNPKNIFIEVLLNKYSRLSDHGYKVEITQEKDMDQIVSQVLAPWLPEIEKTLSYKTTGQEIKEQLEKIKNKLRAKFVKTQNIKTPRVSNEDSIPKKLFKRFKSFLGFK